MSEHIRRHFAVLARNHTTVIADSFFRKYYVTWYLAIRQPARAVVIKSEFPEFVLARQTILTYGKQMLSDRDSPLLGSDVGAFRTRITFTIERVQARQTLVRKLILYVWKQ